jgi:hypothetical protein
MQAGLNLEFARSGGLTLDAAMAKAAEVGHRYVEPYVYSRVCVPINSHLVLESANHAPPGRHNRRQSKFSAGWADRPKPVRRTCG